VRVLGLGAWWLLRPPPDLVARVLFSETASGSPSERLLVAGVMQNRVGHAAFGDSRTLQEVARQPGAYSCVDDPDNTNWRKTLHPEQMTRTERLIWDQCLAMAASAIVPAHGPSGRPLVYYHDRSIRKPSNWDNDLWRADYEVTTAHFVFYSVVPTRR